MNRIRIGYPAGYLQLFWIRMRFGYLILKKIGSGYLFDFYNETSLRVIQDVIHDGAVAIGKTEQHACKASHCGSKQQ